MSQVCVSQMWATLTGTRTPPDTKHRRAAGNHQRSVLSLMFGAVCWNDEHSFARSFYILVSHLCFSVVGAGVGGGASHIYFFIVHWSGRWWQSWLENCTVNLEIWVLISWPMANIGGEWSEPALGQTSPTCIGLPAWWSMVKRAHDESALGEGCHGSNRLTKCWQLFPVHTNIVNYKCSPFWLKQYIPSLGCYQLQWNTSYKNIQTVLEKR